MAKIKISTFFFCIFLGSFLSSTYVDKRIKRLPFWHRYYMNAFFERAIKNDQAGHVLYFNTKPIAVIALVLESRGKTIKEEIRALKGWKTFKKHEPLFPHPNFIFTENLFAPDKDLSVLHIYLINKTTLKGCLKKYEAVFQ